MNLRSTVHAIISEGDRYFVAECMEIPVVTQGLTVDETLANLQEAMALHLEGEDLTELGLVPSPALSVTLELGPVNVPA